MENFKQNKNLVTQEGDDGLVIVPVVNDVAQMDRVFTLNPTGAFVWQLLSKPHSKAFLIAQICEKYDVNEKNAQADLEELLADFIKKKLIVIC